MDLVVSPTVYPLVELCPYVNEILTFDHKGLEQNLSECLKKVSDFCCRYLLKRHFAFAFCPQYGGDKSATLFMTYMSGAIERIGYGFDAWRKLITIPVGYAGIYVMNNILLTQEIFAPSDMVREVDRNFILLTSSGFKVNDTKLEIWYDKEDFFKCT